MRTYADVCGRMLTYSDDAGITRYYLMLYWMRFLLRFCRDGSLFVFSFSLSLFLVVTLSSLSLSVLCLFSLFCFCTLSLSRARARSLFLSLSLSVPQIRREGLLGWLSGIIPALILLINPAIQLSVCVP